MSSVTSDSLVTHTYTHPPQKTIGSISRLRSKAGKLALWYGLGVTLVATHDDVSYIRSFFTAAQDRLGSSEVVKVEVEEAAPRTPRAIYGINRAHRAVGGMYRPRLNWHVPVQDDGTRVCVFCQKKEGVLLSKDEAKVFPITSTSNADILAHIMTRHQDMVGMVHFRKGAADL